MKFISLDISTKTGYAIFEQNDDGVVKLNHYGLLTSKIKNFNVNDHPETKPTYPFNFMDMAEDMAYQILDLVEEIDPDCIVIENTCKGKNRHTQRILEWLHLSVLKLLRDKKKAINYMDVSQWRKILKMRLSNEDKKNNKLVKQKKKRGKITSKHLSVRFCNKEYKLKLLVKDNNQADAIALGHAFASTLK